MNYDTLARSIPWVFHRTFRRELATRMDRRAAGAAMRRAGVLYREMLRRSPSIGRKNELRIYVLTAAYAAAVYKACGLSAEETGAVFSSAMERAAAWRLYMRRTGKKVFTEKWQARRDRVMTETRKREYPANFVAEFIYGDTLNSYRVNYLECGICKLYARENCLELAPYMCRFDYVMARYMGCTLERTRTIAGGDGLCDFHFTKA